MRKLLFLWLLLLFAAPALAQSEEVKLDRFSTNLSPVLNDFQSPQFLFGSVEISFPQDVSMVEIAVKMRDGTGQPIGGSAVTKAWPSAGANQKISFDYSYYNPSAVQQFEPVLVVTARASDGSHIHQVFNPKTNEQKEGSLGY